MGGPSPVKKLTKVPLYRWFPCNAKGFSPEQPNKTVESVHISKVTNKIIKPLNSKEEARSYYEGKKQDYQLPLESIDQVGIALQEIENQRQNKIEHLRDHQRTGEEEKIQERLKELEGDSNFYTKARKLLQQSTFECPICLKELSNDQIVLTDCIHSLCDFCYGILQGKGTQIKCPICKKLVTENQLLLHPVLRENKSKTSTIIKKILETPSEDKVIIFTQFHGCIFEEIYQALKLHGIKTLDINSDDPKKVALHLSYFNDEASVKVLIMSLEKLPIGINIPQANHVIFAHPFLGISSDEAENAYKQCIARVNRIEQKKQVFAYLLLTKGTKEEMKGTILPFTSS